MEPQRQSHGEPSDIETEPAHSTSHFSTSSTSRSRSRESSPGPWDPVPWNPPSWFWDNLSRVPIEYRSLKEFDRRTKEVFAPSPPDSPLDRSALEEHHRAELKLFARRGGPTLDDIRNYSCRRTTHSSMAKEKPSLRIRTPYSNPSEGRTTKTGRVATKGRASKTRRVATKGRATNTGRVAKNGRRKETRKTGPYSPAFLQHLLDHSVYPAFYHRPVKAAKREENRKNPRRDRPVKAANLEEIREKLRRHRPSLSAERFNTSDFENFFYKNKDALSEAAVLSSVFPVIAGSTSDFIARGQNLVFGNLSQLTDGSLANCKPDLYDGSRPAELNVPVRRKLDKYIIPSSYKSRPCLPNFIFEAEGPDGSMLVNENQVLYEGALGARAMHHLRLYGDSTTPYDDKAYTITSTYFSACGHLDVYAHHPACPEDSTNQVQYRQTLLDSWCITKNPDSFRQGVAAFRNAREWAKEQRDELIEAANNVPLHSAGEDTDVEPDEPMEDSFEEWEVSADEDTDPESYPYCNCRIRRCRRPPPEQMSTATTPRDPEERQDSEEPNREAGEAPTRTSIRDWIGIFLSSVH